MHAPTIHKEIYNIIEDYILGYGEDVKDENTSYLYMEFYKKETGNYLSIGMGLRAKKNSGVSFWGFIIKDGRRIGKNFFLYKDMGNKIPLSKQELHISQKALNK